VFCRERKLHMPKFISVTLMAGVTLAASFGMAQQPTPRIKNVPIEQTSPASGQQMYVTYCAVCHGTDGRGNGPAAQAMKVPPADLTALSQKNGGVFPSKHVASVLQFGAENPAHGAADMPIWGDLMLTLHPTSADNRAQMRQRITNLTEYLKKIHK